jgi:hypothetical protein
MRKAIIALLDRLRNEIDPQPQPSSGRFEITLTVQFDVEEDGVFRVTGTHYEAQPIPKSIADRFVRLFTAAPELLAACKALVAWDDSDYIYDNSTFDQVRAAIEHTELSSKNL